MMYEVLGWLISFVILCSVSALWRKARPPRSEIEDWNIYKALEEDQDRWK